MSRSDLRPGAARLQQEAILNSMAARSRSANHCPECGAPSCSNILRTLLARVGRRCTGQVCTARCGWEGEPAATLDAYGQMVKATPEGLPTNEVIGIIPVPEAAAQAEIVRLAVQSVESVVGR